MPNTEPIDVKMSMEVLNASRPVTPLIFHSAARRHVEPETHFNPMRSQEDADHVQNLEAQIKALQLKVELVRTEAATHGRAESDAAHAESLAAERSAITEACTRFAADRERYFTEIEGEVVRLALAIAARILHREVQMDPLLLAASVRIALERLSGQPDIILRVPTANAEAWQTLFPDPAIVEVLPDYTLAPEELTLESPVGQIDLGIPVQLAEIERGFFDLLQKRPS